MLCGCGRSMCVCVSGSTVPPTSGVTFTFPATPTSVTRNGSCNPILLIGLRRSGRFGPANPNRGWGPGLCCWARGHVGVGIGPVIAHLKTKSKHSFDTETARHLRLSLCPVWIDR